MKDYFIAEIKDKNTIESDLLEGLDDSATIKETIYNVKSVNSLDDKDSQNIIEVYSDNHDLSKGDKVFIEKSQVDGTYYYAMGEYVRYSGLLITIGVFLFIVFFLFGKKAFRSIISLFLSIAVIFLILLPLTIKGYNPLLVSAGISIIMLSLIMYITHGFNRVTSSALIGSYISIIFTIVFSFIIINFSKITGNVDDISIYLSINTNNTINLSLLVISSIIIGVIGVVDDAAITQASVVRELKLVNDKLSSFEYYKRAMRVGSSHAGSMINTLVLAYLSSALPLMLLFYTSELPLFMILNKEVVATEIIRSLIGSSGLLLAIPITTAISVYLINKDTKEDIHLEKHYCHHHHH